MKILVGTIEVAEEFYTLGSASINLEDGLVTGNGSGQGTFIGDDSFRNPVAQVAPAQFAVGEVRAFFNITASIRGRQLVVGWDCSDDTPPRTLPSRITRINFLVVG